MRGRVTPSYAWLAGVLLLILLSSSATGSESLPTDPFGGLQSGLDRLLEDMGVSDAVASGRLAVALLKLNGTNADALAMVNGHRMMYAASLPKIAILYGAAVALDQGRLQLNDELQADLVAMIRSSCNSCATRALDAMGRDWLLELLQSEPHRFYDPALGGGLWVGKAYARGAAYERDPLHGLSHGATSWQVARWYFLLINGELASPAQTELMLEALSDPAIAHKFVKGLSEHDTDKIYRKSGTWRHYHADSALVVSKSGSYILVALAADPGGSAWLERLAGRVHEMLMKSDSEEKK